MPDFILAYHGGKQPATPEEGAEQRARWGAWMGGLGDAMVDPGTPLGKSWTVAATGVSEGSPDPLAGYSVVRAESLESALEMAQSCPFLEIGTIEVAEIKQMQP